MEENSRGLVVLFKSSDEAVSKTDDRYVAILNDHGFRAVLIQTLSFEFHVQSLKERLEKPENYSGIILTSQRSVESVYQANPNLTDEWRGKRNFCVGKKTSETALRLLNVTRVLGEDCGNAEKLSALIVQEFQAGFLPLPLLFPCSNLKMDTLPQILKQHDISVDIVTSYTTVCHAYLRENVLKISDQNPDYFVFFSPSGINFSLPFLEETNLLSKVQVICIGQTTARALEEVGVSQCHVCAKPTPEDLIEVLSRLN